MTSLLQFATILIAPAAALIIAYFVARSAREHREKQHRAAE
ncbi:MAG: hypothetical protein ACHQAY_27695 [Hyphomicrobiales bacterium]